MEQIKEIRNQTRINYFARLPSLNLNSLDGSIWQNSDSELKMLTLQAKQRGRLDRAKYEEIIALEKAGYIVIRGLTLQEWQNYFCDIIDDIKINILNKKKIYVDIKNFFDKEQQNKLITVLVYSNKYKFNEECLFQRDYKFPPLHNLNKIKDYA